VESRLELEKWRNSNREDKLVPMSLITKDLLPPWMSFYEKKARFDPKVDSILKKVLSTLRGLKWSEEKIIAFNQY